MTKEQSGKISEGRKNGTSTAKNKSKEKKKLS